ncbi:hypothetical protein GN244_ATG01425 [Phytophthora infestans]|uniref:Uncharacterized protein n=1 Tax=Phytophthora infestans TaxID=4787 RepID=A0A833SD76_PHYIN|nr:hypothetical protein GN244_ATG01425 [Phytophthora infestans]
MTTHLTTARLALELSAAVVPASRVRLAWRVRRLCRTSSFLSTISSLFTHSGAAVLCATRRILVARVQLTIGITKHYDNHSFLSEKEISSFLSVGVPIWQNVTSRLRGTLGVHPAVFKLRPDAVEVNRGCYIEHHGSVGSGRYFGGPAAAFTNEDARAFARLGGVFGKIKFEK